MIAYVSGILEMKLNGYIVIDVGGIGYKVFMSESAIDSLGELGEKVKVYTHHHVREDDISLYGFLSMEELNMFEMLISVSGVGAKSALSILTNVEPSSFALAVISNDVSKLVKIPGIGKKTAARIVLELKDKLKTEEAITETEEVEVAIKEDNKTSEVIAALQVLGYTRKEIDKVLEKMDLDTMELEGAIKIALKLLQNL